MGNPKGTKPVVLYRATADRLMTRYELRKIEKTDALSFQRFVNEIIMDRLDKEDLLREKFAHLSKIAIQDNVIFIRDTKESSTTEVWFKDGNLYCHSDRSASCEHVQFAWALPELAKAVQLKKAAR
jgi:hypothetical protein